MTNWISVYERLPEIEDGLSGVYVLVAFRYRVFHNEFRYEIHEGLYEGGSSFKLHMAPSDKNTDIGIACGRSEECRSSITHWMPLPEPPKLPKKVTGQSGKPF